MAIPVGDPTWSRHLAFMPTIKIQDWTKERLEEIKDEEDHTSLDSVIKSLLKERENK